MKTYSWIERPLKVFGIPFFDERKTPERLPLYLREKLKLEALGKRCPGARVGFRTDAKSFTVRVTLKTLSPDVGMSIFACQSVSCMIGERQRAVFAGLVNPPDYNTRVFEKTFKKSDRTEEVTLWLVRNEEIENVEVILPDEAHIEEPTPYKFGKALYYGSSITEGGCCSNVINAYNALLSRWLDLDYYNFGFSGSCKGEIVMADYINTLDMSLFVMDYDHNAPTAEHLQRTHEAFFKRIREKNKDLPILLISRPYFGYYDGDDVKRRKKIIETTYKNAVNSGDKNVYYIDGGVFFEEDERSICSVDATHPNDLGFYRMACAIRPVMEKILAEKN